MPTHNPDRSVRHGLVAGDDLFYIFTSGTTGYPKPARFSHMRFIAIGDGMAGVAGYGAADVLYCPIPLYHGAGGVVVPASALHVGAAIALRRRFSASAFWDDCRRFGATGFQYVGEICQFLLSQPPRPTDRTPPRAGDDGDRTARRSLARLSAALRRRPHHRVVRLHGSQHGDHQPRQQARLDRPHSVQDSCTTGG